MRHEAPETRHDTRQERGEWSGEGEEKGREEGTDARREEQRGERRGQRRREELRREVTGHEKRQNVIHHSAMPSLTEPSPKIQWLWDAAAGRYLVGKQLLTREMKECMGEASSMARSLCRSVAASCWKVMKCMCSQSVPPRNPLARPSLTRAIFSCGTLERRCRTYLPPKTESDATFVRLGTRAFVHQESWNTCPSTTRSCSRSRLTPWSACAQ